MQITSNKTKLVCSRQFKCDINQRTAIQLQQNVYSCTILRIYLVRQIVQTFFFIHNLYILIIHDISIQGTYSRTREHMTLFHVFLFVLYKSGKHRTLVTQIYSPYQHAKVITSVESEAVDFPVQFTRRVLSVQMSDH